MELFKDFCCSNFCAVNADVIPAGKFEDEYLFGGRGHIDPFVLVGCGGDVNRVAGFHCLVCCFGCSKKPATFAKRLPRTMGRRKRARRSDRVSSVSFAPPSSARATSLVRRSIFSPTWISLSSSPT